MEKIDISQRVKDESLYKNASLVLGLILIFLGIKDLDYLKLGLGILFIFYFTYKKKVYLTDEGVLFTYRGLLYNREELIDKKNIQEVLVVKQGLRSTLYFVMEPTAKKVVVETEKLDEIIEFLKKRLRLYIAVESKI
ncbi:MAG: hypothetical protein GX300_04720 [Tissierellia bacterium]|nr:hypothetical protein [Tissierellia bacterium]